MTMASDGGVGSGDSQQDAARDAERRNGLAQQLARGLADWGAGELEDLRRTIDELLDRVTPTELDDLLEKLRSTGSTWGYHPSDRFVRSLSRRVMASVLTEGTGMDGAERLEIARERGVIFIGNHLSYVDANVFDQVCDRTGYGDVASRLATIVGPKVYTAPIRRLASLCFGTIKTPQSTSRASDEAVMSARDVARVARQTLTAARERAELGDHLMIFAEGSRSRTAALERLLPAVARYLDIPNAQVVPWVHTGSESLVPLSEDHVYPCPVRVRIGRALSAEKLIERCEGNRALVMDAIGFWLADMLPERYRGVYGKPTSEGLAAARQIADELGPAAY